jgi:hypothetical protein
LAKLRLIQRQVRVWIVTAVEKGNRDPAPGKGGIVGQAFRLAEHSLFFWMIVGKGRLRLDGCMQGEATAFCGQFLCIDVYTRRAETVFGSPAGKVTTDAPDDGKTAGDALRQQAGVGLYVAARAGTWL